MVKAYDFDNSENVLSLEDLKSLGVLYFPMDMTSYTDRLNQICTERGYKNRDEVKLSKDTPGLEDKLKIFFEEHLHDDEEIRFILDGCGFFDVRDKQDKWVRIRVEKGDLIIVPANMYHRFALDENRFVHAMRLFTDAPKKFSVVSGYLSLQLTICIHFGSLGLACSYNFSHDLFLKKLRILQKLTTH
ncbi:ARD/ARD' family protein [Tieghemostelium lacteum]|uniref:Acireductone dioxygenase n=1 Tax=Tieghemostelium lacteum TaxID=361077 RepID=A0A151ZF81_TIELA|nr:ARD/ARD' family protein [Tieghemostelium lacteum]|eukprot:KYQ92587.1 ARD/ARD' family protein [Tieghemostelium lacteum]